jgi:hypothetical protein
MEKQAMEEKEGMKEEREREQEEYSTEVVHSLQKLKYLLFALFRKCFITLALDYPLKS